MSDDVVEHNHAMPPTSMTSACASFYVEHHNVQMFMVFVVQLVSSISRGEQHRLELLGKAELELADAIQAIVDAEVRERADARPSEHHAQTASTNNVIDDLGVRDHRAKGEEALRRAKERHPVWNEFLSYQNSLLQMTLARVVDNYIIYFRDLLGLIYAARPETMKSAASNETYEFILEYSTMDDLIAALVAKRMEALEHQGLREFAAYFERLGFELFTPEALERLLQLTEQRNIIVHNRGMLNRRYIDTFGTDGDEVGQSLGMTLTDVNDAIDFLATQVTSVDEHASCKFGLATPLNSDAHGCVTGPEHVCKFVNADHDG